MGKIINSAIDIGLKAILPDLIENEVIFVKDCLIEEGFREGVNAIVKSCVDFGKSAIGMVTGEFENIEQMENAIKKGGIIDTVSELIDYGLKICTNKKIIDSSTSKLIKQGKNTILDALESKIEDIFTEQVKNIEKLEKSNNEWNEYYNNKDLEGMEKSYKKIKTYLNKIIPLENNIKEARKIENIHNLIKSKGGDFELSDVELNIAEKI